MGVAASLLAGCHGGKAGGVVAPDEAPYVSARPIYAPQPINPLYISGYAGRGGAARVGPAVVPVVPAEPAEPSLLP
jgi:hypothetical protein